MDEGHVADHGDDRAGDGLPLDLTLDLALEVGDLGTWHWDMTSGTVVWNARMEEIFGFAPGEFDGTFESYEARLHPDEADRMRAEIEAALAEGGRYNVEHRAIRPDGSVRWVRGIGQVLTDDDGTPTGSTGCAADITDHVVSSAERAGLLERLTFLTKASEMLSRSLDLDETLDQIVALAVPRIADAVVLVVLDRGEPVVRAARHADPARDALMRELYARYPIRLGRPGVGQALATGQVQLVPEVPDELLRRVAHDDEHLAMISQLRLGSGLVVPLLVGEQVIGALGLALDRGHAVTDDIRHIAEALASRAAVALENARLHWVATSVSAALQAGLAPPALPQVEGLEVAARYLAAGEGVVVGGDYYDLVEVPGDGWLLTIGDVCGRGPGAASMNAQLRFAARALTRSGMSTATVAEALNRDLLADAEDGMFATAVLARLRPREGHTAVELVAAGHPAPVVAPADGPPRPVRQSGPLLGVVPSATYVPVDVDLGPDDLLVLVTDGVLEARDATGELFGDARLLEVLATCDRTADGCADDIQTAVVDFAGGPDDDVAIVVIRAT